MQPVRFFRDLEAWQAAMDLAVEAHLLADGLPPRHRYALGDQIRKSATSVPSNVAEGHAHGLDRVFLRHTRIAIGSLAELETQLEIASRLKLIAVDVKRAIENHVKRTGQLLHGLRRILKASVAKPIKRR